MSDVAAKTMQLDIVSPEASIFSGEVVSVSVTGELGELGILPGHTPLLTQLKPGQVRVHMLDGEEDFFYISGGLMEVQPKVVMVMCDTVARAADLDETEALEAKERAQRALSKKEADFEYSTVLAELAQSAAQIRAIQELRKHKK